MTHKLVKITPSRGGSRFIKDICISNDKQKLEDFCFEKFKLNVGKPISYSNKPYYIIENSNMKII